MRRPHLSTGAWIFLSVVTAAIVAPVGVYAAATSTVSIGNTNNANTATVTPTNQLQTTMIAPKSVVRFEGAVATGGNCSSIYTPPTGKAFVVTQITYDLGTGTTGNEAYAELEESCPGSYPFDFADTSQAFETQTHTFPTGLPVAAVNIWCGAGNGFCIASGTGYLIPATQLPAATPPTASAFHAAAVKRQKVRSVR
jgi:hypothetical protein